MFKIYVKAVEWKPHENILEDINNFVYFVNYPDVLYIAVYYGVIPTSLRS